MRLRNPCDDDANMHGIARVLAFPTKGTECTCCLGARIWLALVIGFVAGFLF